MSEKLKSPERGATEAVDAHQGKRRKKIWSRLIKLGFLSMAAGAGILIGGALLGPPGIGFTTAVLAGGIAGFGAVAALGGSMAPKR